MPPETAVNNPPREKSGLAKGTFDLVLTEIVMPDKEGIETIMAIRRDKPELKIIAMSGGGRGDKSSYLELAALLGASRTLSKPFSPQVLRDAVNDVLAC
jgi:DNA-binding NarL/FixJ family response regulator